MVLAWIFLVLSTTCLAVSVLAPLYFIGTTDGSTAYYRTKFILSWFGSLCAHLVFAWVLGTLGGSESLMSPSHQTLFVVITWLLRLLGFAVITRGLMVGPRPQAQYGE